MNELGTISGAALQQYLASARTLGVDTDAALGRADLTPSQVEDPDSRVAGERFERLLEALLEASGDPLFGLHTSRFIQPGSYNVMGYIAMSAASIGEALSRVSLYERLVGDMGTTETRFRGDQVEVRWHCRHRRQPVRRHLIENVLASWVRYTRWLADDQSLCPDAVLLEHPAPPGAGLLKEYQRVFRCEIRFEQPRSALVGNRALLAHPLRQPDPELFATLEAHAERKMERLGVGTTLATKVRQRLRESLQQQQLPRRKDIASELHMNVRTLHRRLGEDGTSWRQLLDEVRQELARHYLRETRLSQLDIAERLAYADIRSFQRAFRRHHRMTPGVFRRQA